MRSIKLVAAMAATILGTWMFDSSAARADTFYMCGHEIRTSYRNGWVIIDSVSGVTADTPRVDIEVWGMGEGGFKDRQPVINAIYSGVGFAWMYSRIAIKGYDTPETGGCNVALH